MANEIYVTNSDAISGKVETRLANTAEKADLKTIQNSVAASELEIKNKIALRVSALAKLAEIGLTAEEIAAL